LLPMMLTRLPTAPLRGVNPAITMPAPGTLTLKGVLLVTVAPPALVTLIAPLPVLLLPTWATIWVSLQLTMFQGWPLKLTVLPPESAPNPLPLMLTWIPGAPLLGEKPFKEIWAEVVTTVNGDGLETAGWEAVETVILPLAAPCGTVTTSCVLEALVTTA
jgi:hypothetical protein